MTTSISGDVPVSLEVPQSQNTAPVLEFRCLYTQDIRRKQKRWQDGRLKFHTFNKRVMVYDDRSNFVGDTHWRGDSEFDEGEELELERGGTLVEVGECVGKRDQDLTELVDKRVKEREERVAAKFAAGSPSAGLMRAPGTPTASAYLRQKPLNAMLTPSGHYGRALLPENSPFEERQRLNGKKEDEENERPTKRRKQIEPSSSKSGYAQNLMGATLNLASSRPPSTASMRYEPFRTVVPSGKQIASTIDLTMDEDDEGMSSISNPVVTARTERERPAKIQKRIRKSPPRKSGYASNLTGAALSLSRPPESKRSAPRAPAPKQVAPVVEGSNNSSSSLVEEDSFLYIHSPEKPPPRVIRKEKEVVKKLKEVPKTKPPLQLDFSTPLPPPASKISEISKHHESRRQETQTSSIIEPTPERPTSALRIKPRPPKRMMMLMDRPSSRPMIGSEAIQSAQKSSGKSFSRNEEPVLSQATIELNEFCKKQEEKLRARLNRRKPVEIHEFSSSPDKGIDAQTIDRMLSRRNVPAVESPGELSDPGISRSSRPGPSTSQSIIQVAPALNKRSTVNPSLSSPNNENENPDVPGKSTSASGTSLSRSPDNNEITSRGYLSPEPPVKISETEKLTTTRVSHHGHDSEAPDQTASSPHAAVPQVNFPNSEIHKLHIPEKVAFSETIPSGDGHHQVTSTPDLVVEKEAASKTAQVQENSDELPPITVAEEAQTTPQSRPSVPQNVGRKKVVVTPQLASAIQSATDHFRSIIKSSNTPSNSMIEIPVFPDQGGTSEPPEPVIAQTVVKPSPRSSPLLVNETGFSNPLGAQNPPEVSPGTDMQTAATSNISKGAAQRKPFVPPRARLVNPATGGISVQSLAVITASMLATNPMAPPPRVISRVNRMTTGNESVARPVKEDSPGGPWSRESFDLFGNWRPPGREVV